MRKWIASACLFLSITALAAPSFLIQGKPVELELHEGYFTFPDGYVQPSEYQSIEYHFISLNDVNRVCFIQALPGFETLDMVELVLEEPNDKTLIRWNCYRFDPRYFQLDY